MALLVEGEVVSSSKTQETGCWCQIVLLKAITTPNSRKIVLQPLELQTYPGMKIDNLDVAMGTLKHEYFARRRG